MACVAWPTCGLSITEAERALPTIDRSVGSRTGQARACRAKCFTLRMTGCPNGCARPYNCDIGLVGKAHDKYTVFVGGRLLGDRLNFIYKDMVPTSRSRADVGAAVRLLQTGAAKRRDVRRLLLPPRRGRVALLDGTLCGRNDRGITRRCSFHPAFRFPTVNSNSRSFAAAGRAGRMSTR